MQDALLEGMRVLVLGGEPAVRTGRVLADLGAEVIRVTRALDPLVSTSVSWLAWTAGSTVVIGDETSALALARDADVVIDTPKDPASLVIDPMQAPAASWVHITPFGMTGPRADWRATDLGIMASSGNMYSTGYADRAPIRATEPTSYAHVAGEAAFAAIAAINSGRRQIADVSTQECICIASMGAAGRHFRAPSRGGRGGANIGRTREIWPTQDGYVSFGIRGGKARQASMRLIAQLVHDAGIECAALDQDWSSWSQVTAPHEELMAMETAVGEFFSRNSMQSLYDIACEKNLMLAPANSPVEIFASAQLDAREFFTPLGSIAKFPRSFVKVHGAAEAGPRAPATVRTSAAFESPTRFTSKSTALNGEAVFHGLNILEFGSGAAGPIATRYFAEHGATVVRIESKTRPDFLRTMALGPNNPHGLEGSDLYDALNCGKANVTLNLKHPEAVALVKRLVVEWADVVAENYAPKAMMGFGLDYATLRTLKPDLVMVSACLNGQTGPHKDYPGFGGQGSALAGWNWVTGWPDREPVGPYGTITDSLAPRYVAAALAAGVLHHRRTGNGCYLDVSQVEAGLWALSPWLLEYQRDTTVGMRDGNRSRHCAPHGAFRCADEFVNGETIDDRWIAIACHTDKQWQQLAGVIGADSQRFTSISARITAANEIEEVVNAWTATRTRDEVATQLQALGIEAVPVADFADVALIDAQLQHRKHFVALQHPVLGEGRYERNGIRFSQARSGYENSGPMLGDHNDWILNQVLEIDLMHIAEMRVSGAVE